MHINKYSIPQACSKPLCKPYKISSYNTSCYLFKHNKEDGDLTVTLDKERVYDAVRQKPSPDYYIDKIWKTIEKFENNGYVDLKTVLAYIFNKTNGKVDLFSGFNVESGLLVFYSPCQYFDDIFQALVLSRIK